MLAGLVHALKDRSLRVVPPLGRRLQAARAEQQAQAAFADPRLAPVLIYQMGKVGSASVYRALRRSPLRRAVLHLHFLSDELEQHVADQVRRGLDPPAYHFALGRAVRGRLDAEPGRRCRVISLVRDPIAFALSNLFENPHLLAQADTRDPAAFLQAQLGRPGALRYVDEWFDRELRRVFGVDVFATPFPAGAGFATYRSARADVLVVRLEDLSARGPRALAAFLGLSAPVPLRRHNARAASRRYAAARAALQLDAAACERVYAGRLAQHFYSADERAVFAERWRGRGGARTAWC